MSNSEYLNCSASLYLFQLLSRSINFRISECSTWFSQVQWGLLCFYFDKSYIFVCFFPDNYEKSNFSNLCWCCCVLAEQYGKLSFFQVDVIDVKYFVKTWNELLYADTKLAPYLTQNFIQNLMYMAEFAFFRLEMASWVHKCQILFVRSVW